MAKFYFANWATLADIEDDRDVWDMAHPSGLVVRNADEAKTMMLEEMTVLDFEYLSEEEAKARVYSWEDREPTPHVEGHMGRPVHIERTHFALLCNGEFFGALTLRPLLLPDEEVS